MTTSFAIQTAIEIIVATALIIGLVFEDKIAQAEQGIINKIKRSRNYENH